MSTEYDINSAFIYIKRIIDWKFFIFTTKRRNDVSFDNFFYSHDSKNSSLPES